MASCKFIFFLAIVILTMVYHGSCQPQPPAKLPVSGNSTEESGGGGSTTKSVCDEKQIFEKAKDEGLYQFCHKVIKHLGILEGCPWSSDKKQRLEKVQAALNETCSLDQYFLVRKAEIKGGASISTAINTSMVLLSVLFSVHVSTLGF